MKFNITLRNPRESDFDVFFEHQLEPVDASLASLTTRSRDTFIGEWAKMALREGTILKTAVVNDRVAGYIVSWRQSSKSKVGYWYGKEYWNQGIATEALKQFLVQVPVRPIYARVGKRNIASIRVLQKNWFSTYFEEPATNSHDDKREHLILILE